MLVKKSYDKLYPIKKRLKDELFKSLIAKWIAEKPKDKYGWQIMGRRRCGATTSYRMDIMDMSQYPLKPSECYVSEKES